MANQTTDDLIRAGLLIRRIEQYRESRPKDQDAAAARVMSAIVRYARAIRAAERRKGP